MLVEDNEWIALVVRTYGGLKNQASMHGL